MTAMPLALQETLATAGLPAAVRTKRDLLANLLPQSRAAPHGSKELARERAAQQMRAAGYRMTADGIRALMARWNEKGAKAFTDRRMVPHDEKKGLALPAGFKDWVKGRFQKQMRSEAQAYEEIIKEWRAGRLIPGYPISPKADPYTGIPRGWSLKNLQRACRSGEFEKASMRYGLGYAKAKHGVRHFNTRKDLWHLSHIMPDDVDHDNFVYVGTKSESCRVAQLGMLDVFSGMYFRYGTRPMLKRWDAKQNKFVTDKLKEANMRFLVAMQLFEDGYSPLGTCYPAELGTATMREDVARILHDRTKEIHGEALLRVDLSGWTGKKQIVEGMFIGRGGGNPRHKAPLESLHNLIHNKLACLPGQTGPDVERRPEQLHGMLKAQDELMEIAKTLTPWQAEQLQYPLLEYRRQFLPVLEAMIDSINRRRNHALEGWHELGFTTDQYRFHRDSEEWLTPQQYLALPDLMKQALAIEVKKDRALHRPSQLSPHDVFAQQRGGVVRASISMIAEILYIDLAVARKCKGAYIRFTTREISPEELVYEKRIVTADGREKELPDDTYEVVVNPFQPDRLWVYTSTRGKGAFLGTARRAVQSSRVNREQAVKELAHEQKRYADMAAPLKRLHADITAEERARLRNNNAVISGPRSPEEQRAEETRREVVLTQEDRQAMTPELRPEPDAPATIDLSDVSSKDFI